MIDGIFFATRSGLSIFRIVVKPIENIRSAFRMIWPRRFSFPNGSLSRFIFRCRYPTQKNLIVSFHVYQLSALKTFTEQRYSLPSGCSVLGLAPPNQSHTPRLILWNSDGSFCLWIKGTSIAALFPSWSKTRSSFCKNKKKTECSIKRFFPNA